MNKHIYVNDIQRIIKSLQPPIHHPEFNEWHHNAYLKVLDAILLKYPSQHLNKTSLDQIHVLYAKHWDEIAGSPACYTGDKEQTHINQVFIQVAIYIAMRFPERYSHYYQLLMPSARNLNKQFLSTLEEVVNTPLNALFVANNFSLFSIEDTVAHAQDRRYLANVEHKEFPALAFEEKEQLLRHKLSRGITTELMFPPKKAVGPQKVVNIRTDTAEAVRVLGIGCLRGMGEASQLAIASFYHHLKTLSAEEKAFLDNFKDFNTVFTALIGGNACIYGCGEYFCGFAYNFIRDESKWSDNHIQGRFPKYVRIQLSETTPLLTCIDAVVEVKEINPVNLDQVALDEENAMNQLDLLKTFIEKTHWDLRDIKHTSLELPHLDNRKQLPTTVKTAYMIIYKGITHRDAQPVKLLLEVKELFCRSYFSEADSKNAQVLAFYRSFYTNKHMGYMFDQLTEPTQIDEPKIVGMMEIRH